MIFVPRAPAAVTTDDNSYWPNAKTTEQHDTVIARSTGY